MKKWVWTLAVACVFFLLAPPLHNGSMAAGGDKFVRAPSESEVRLQKLDTAHAWTTDPWAPAG
ncbi:MAG: hypothetical protein K6E40_00725 [Desulfovibrio sp.]|nr:hypothetical protein [Desulfovibrio sp.]